MSEWMPIELAPKDGTPIYARTKDKSNEYCVVYLSDLNGWFTRVAQTSVVVNMSPGVTASIDYAEITDLVEWKHTSDNSGTAHEQLLKEKASLLAKIAVARIELHSLLKAMKEWSPNSDFTLRIKSIYNKLIKKEQ